MRRTLSRGWRAAAMLAVPALLAVPAALAQAASTARPELRAGGLQGEIRLDGLLDEPAWAEADSEDHVTSSGFDTAETKTA